MSGGLVGVELKLRLALEWSKGGLRGRDHHRNPDRHETGTDQES